jgi:hypothetical protein
MSYGMASTTGKTEMIPRVIDSIPPSGGDSWCDQEMQWRGEERLVHVSPKLVERTQRVRIPTGEGLATPPGPESCHATGNRRVEA